MASGPNWKSSVILGGIALLIAGAVWMNESVWKIKQESKEKQSNLVFQLRKQGIQKISIVTQSAAFQFDCQDDPKQKCKPGDKSRWKISVPIATAADDAVIDSFLSSIENLEATDSISLKDESAEQTSGLLKEYGLDDAAITQKSARLLEITQADGTTQKVYFGATSPIGETTYAVSSLDPKKIWLTPSYFRAQFDKDLSSWRDKKLFAFSAGDITGFSLNRSPQQLNAEYIENPNGWILDGRYPADGQAMDGFLNTLAYLHAEKFVAEDKTSTSAKAYLKGAPAYRIKIATRTEPKQTELVLYLGPKQVYGTLAHTPFVYEFNPAIPNRLTKTLKDLRQSKLLPTTDRLVTAKMEWTHPRLGSFTVQRSGTTWKVLTPGGEEPADDQAVSTVLDRLSSPIVKDYLKSVPGAAQLKCKLWDQDGKLQKEFQFSKQGTRVFARELTDKNREGFELDSSMATTLPWDRNLFVKAKTAASK